MAQGIRNFASVCKRISAISSKHRRRRCLHNSATWAPVVAENVLVDGVVVEGVDVDVGVTAADDAHVAPPLNIYI